MDFNGIRVQAIMEKQRRVCFVESDFTDRTFIVTDLFQALIVSQVCATFLPFFF